jgi:CubicO group peptidase (beta-lactamase class C family)
MTKSDYTSRVRVDETLFGAVIKALGTAIDKDGHRLNMDSIIISQGERTFAHHFTSESAMNDLRSLSKPILCLAIGIAIDNGLELRGNKLGLDTLIWPFFEDRVSLTNVSNKTRLKRVKLRHLLNHTIGYDVGLMFSKDVKERDPSTLLDYVFNTNISHEPGEHFVYSNVGPYIISALIQEELGINLSSWVAQHLFSQLGITNYEWSNYGDYCAASSGLRLMHADLHKIARIFANDGRHGSTQVVPQHWIEQMRTPQIATPMMYDETRVFPKYAYGQYLWICKDGSYYCDGTDGQYFIVLPKSGIVITTFGHQPDMKPITRCFTQLL